MALALGVIYVFGFFLFGVQPQYGWPATLLAVGGLYALLHRNAARPGWIAWWFGVGKYGFGASWVYVSINVYGNAPPPLAAFLVVIFVAGLSLLFVAPLGYLFARLRVSAQHTVSNVLCFVGAWLFMDWVSSWFLTGFPWLLPGYALVDTPVASAAAVIGVLGLSGVCVLTAALLAAAALQRKIRLGLLALVPVVAAYALSFVTWVTPGETQQVALVQGNIDQAVKWLPDQAAPNVRKHLRLSADHWDADILMWPEAAVTLYPRQAQGLLESLGAQGRDTQTDIVLGIPGTTALPDGDYEFHNMAIGLGEARGRFAKYHLVPFGEYVPLESLLRGLIEFFDLPMSSSSPGSASQPNIRLRSGEAAMAICYEIAYPDSMRRRAADAAVLMTISNDTWFGTSIGPLQHMQIARMRAVENGRWLLRATNNGVTAIVDHNGHMTAQLPQFTEGVLRGEVRIMQGRTPYSAAGHWPVLVSLLGFLGWLLLLRRRPAP
jgi:apolipoprotein N-acyltransferase